MLPWQPPSTFNSAGDGSGAGQQYRPLFNQNEQQSQQQSNSQQNQQQPQQGQQQGGQPPAPVYTAPTLASTLHFLQSEHRRYARDRNEWEIERAEMRARIALLEGEKRGNEGALRDLGRRCKMLEMALRGERSKFLSTTNALGNMGVPGQTPSPSGTSSPVPAGTVPLPATAKAAAATGAANAAGTPAAAAAATSAAAGPESAAMAPSTSMTGTPASAAAPVAGPAAAIGRGPGIAVHPAHIHPTSNGPSRPVSQLGLNGNTGTWGPGAGATLAGGRDPRGKARSRDYLKQCLQEITYLTSSTTLNPLGPTSFGAPGLPRPRKVLPDHVPATSAPGGVAVPGLLSLPGALSGLTSSADVPSTASPAGAAPVTTPAPAGATPAQGKQIAEFKSASDPASAFVPLKRTISQQGQGGPRSVHQPSEQPSAVEEEAPQPSSAEEAAETALGAESSEQPAASDAEVEKAEGAAAMETAA